MPYVRLGIIANTRQVSTLPVAAVEDAFRHVDAILHAGDSSTPLILEQLAGIAPVLAVRGDEDADAANLPTQRVLAFNHVRIGIIHGDRHPWVENYFRLKRCIRGHGTGSHALFDALLRRFQANPVDAIIFGHPEIPFSGWYQSVHFFNPGAVYSDPSSYTRPDHTLPRSTVGILEIYSDRSIQTRWIDLPALALR
jgi:hypothetical protein